MHHSRSSISTFLILASTLFVTAGCSESVIGNTDQPQVEAPQITDDISVYILRGPEEIGQALQSDELQWRPSLPFYAAMLHLTAPGAVELEYTAQREDGTWTEYRPVEFVSPESQQITVQIAYDTKLQAVKLRVNQGKESLERVRADLLHEPIQEGEFHTEDDLPDPEDPTFDPDEIVSAVSIEGRYRADADALEKALKAPVKVTGAGLWKNRKCKSGDFNQKNITPGAKALKAYIKKNFKGVLHIGGYGCRPIASKKPVSKKSLSVHGTGRALDVHFDLFESSGKPITLREAGVKATKSKSFDKKLRADNTLGDKLANFLIANSSEIGVQRVIWDNTIWTSGQAKDKFYGSNGKPKSNFILRHEDHVHVELSVEAGQRGTSWFKDGKLSSAPTSGASTAPPASQMASCKSKMLKGLQVKHGTTVQMDYPSSCGGACSWATCDDGGWSCSSNPSQKDHPLASCTGKTPTTKPSPLPNKQGCQSSTLNRTVTHGTCVQTSYTNCGGRCKFSQCQDGAFSCVPREACEPEKVTTHPNCSN